MEFLSSKNIFEDPLFNVVFAGSAPAPAAAAPADEAAPAEEAAPAPPAEEAPAS